MTQTTPWASFVTPEPSEDPDIPADFRRLAVRMDDILRFIIGGATAPTGPLDTPVTEMETIVNNANDRITGAEEDISALQTTTANTATRVTTLEQRPYVQQAYIWSPPGLIQIPGNRGSDTTVVNQTIPAVNYPRLVIAYCHSMWFWNNEPSRTNLTMGKLWLGGKERIRQLQTGNVQAHTGWAFDDIPANTTMNIRHTVNIYAAAPSTALFETIEMDPLVFALAIPWFGNTVTYPFD